MPNDLLNNRIQNFTQEYRDFVMSDFVTVVGREAQALHGWSADTRDIFENMIFLYITLFCNRIQCIEAVVLECDLSVTNALSVVNTAIAKMPKEMLNEQRAAILTLLQSDNDIIAEKDRLIHLESLSLQKLSVYIYVKTTKKITRFCYSRAITDPSTIAICHTLLGDIILGFYKIEDTVPLLQQELGIDAKTAALLGADVLDFLAPLSDPNFVVPVETEDAYMPVVVETPAPLTPAASYAAVQNQAPVTIPQPIPELHTMATDASVVRASYQPTAQPEPTYSSEQPIIRKPLSDTPSYANGTVAPTPHSAAIPPIEPPRWG